MHSIHILIKQFINSGTSALAPFNQTRYIRFLNITLLIIICAQLPIIPLLIVLDTYGPLMVNIGTLLLCGLGWILNRKGMHVFAKTLVLTVVSANTIYFILYHINPSPINPAETFW